MYEKLRWAFLQLIRPGGLRRDPAFGRRVGDLVRGAGGTRWPILDLRYPSDTVTRKPIVEYLVRPIRLIRKLPPLWIVAERFIKN